MKLDADIWCRVDKNLKRRLLTEVKRRGLRGLAAKEADVIREALVEYFEARDDAPTGNGKALAS